jgi:hypothetical protein
MMAMGSVYPDRSTRSLNSSMYTSTFHLPWKYWSDSSLISAVVASFSGQNAAVNPSLNSSHDAKHIFLVRISCRIMHSAKVAARPPLK